MGRNKKFKESKAKREPGGFVALPYIVIRSDVFRLLSAHAVKLLIDLLAQYRGNNNGDLCAAWRVMQPCGWRSRDTLCKAIVELRKGGWIEVSRQGGRHVASLYAVSFFAIDDCKGKLDIKSTGSPNSLWKKNAPLPPLPKLKVVTRIPCQTSDNKHVPRVNLEDTSY